MPFPFQGPTPAESVSSCGTAVNDLRQQAPHKCAASACLPARSDAGARTYSQPDAAGDGGQARSAGSGLVSSQTSGISSEPIRVDPVASRLQRMRRRVLTGARLHVGQVPKWRAAMLTLTYRPDVDWDGRHVSECLRHARQWLKRRGVGIRYVWVMETTKAGKPHYHLVVWLPFGVKLPMLDLQGWWPHGMTRMEWAKCAVGYVSKYVSKGEEGAALPFGARMYSVGGLEDVALDEARWWSLPAWLRDQLEFGIKDLLTAINEWHYDLVKGQPLPEWFREHLKALKVRRMKGGGWLDHESGEVFYSPWRVMFRGGLVYLIRIDAAELPEMFRMRNVAAVRVTSHALVTPGLASEDGHAAVVA